MNTENLVIFVYCGCYDIVPFMTVYGISPMITPMKSTHGSVPFLGYIAMVTWGT